MCLPLGSLRDNKIVNRQGNHKVQIERQRPSRTGYSGFQNTCSNNQRAENPVSKLCLPSENCQGKQKPDGDSSATPIEGLRRSLSPVHAGEAHALAKSRSPQWRLVMFLIRVSFVPLKAEYIIDSGAAVRVVVVGRVAG